MSGRIAARIGVSLTLGLGLVLVATTSASAEVTCERTEYTEPISYTTSYVDDPNLPQGQQVTDVAGVNGVRTEERCSGTNEMDEPIEPYTQMVTTSDPVNEVIRVGTYVAPTPTTPSTTPSTTLPTRPTDDDEPEPVVVEAPVPVVTPTPAETATPQALELEPTLYNVQPTTRSNLVATGALAGAIITACALLLAALFYRRFLRDRLPGRR